MKTIVIGDVTFEIEKVLPSQSGEEIRVTGRHKMEGLLTRHACIEITKAQADTIGDLFKAMARA